MFKIPLYVTAFILIIMALFLVVRETFVGFDEHKPPLDHEQKNFIPKNPFATACLGCN